MSYLNPRAIEIDTPMPPPAWAVLEWECCLKDAVQGAQEGAPFIQQHLIKKADRAFDDFAGSNTDTERNRRILGLTD